MKPKINICMSIDVESVVRLDPDRPDEIDEEIKLLCDLLTDLRHLLSRYAEPSLDRS